MQISLNPLISLKNYNCNVNQKSNTIPSQQYAITFGADKLKLSGIDLLIQKKIRF